MSDGTSFIFFQGGPFDLGDAARALTDRGISVTSHSDQLTVRWDDGPEMTIVLARGGHVQQEAAEIGENSPHAAAMSLCDARFEVGFESLDEVLDEINTLIEVQTALQDLTQGFLFNTWNGRLLAPGE